MFRVVSWNRNSSEMSASEKHEKGKAACGYHARFRPYVLYQYEKGNRRTRKSGEDEQMSRHSKCGYFLQKILLVVIFRSGLCFWNIVSFLRGN